VRGFTWLGGFRVHTTWFQGACGNLCFCKGNRTGDWPPDAVGNCVHEAAARLEMHFLAPCTLPLYSVFDLPLRVLVGSEGGPALGQQQAQLMKTICVWPSVQKSRKLCVVCVPPAQKPMDAISILDFSYQKRMQAVHIVGFPIEQSMNAMYLHLHVPVYLFIYIYTDKVQGNSPGVRGREEFPKS